MNYKCLFLILILLSCSDKEKNIQKSVNPTSYEGVSSAVVVKCDTVRYGDFFLELNTTGKIFSQRKAELKFVLNEKVNSILVKNGQKVFKGQILARQENTISRNKILKAKEQLDRAKIDVEDILIGFNYSFKDSISVPKTVLNMAKNRSNYNSSISNLNDAKIELSSTILRSPINGIVANLDAKKFSYPDNNEPFCTIIDNSLFEVEFSVIEDDYVFLTKGQPIEVLTLLNEDTIKGEITEINPTVDDNGMIKVRGIIKNAPENIIDGINVNVIIKKKIANKLSVLKESIVLRDNKKVVFTYKDGTAIWNYVETSFENYNYTVIEKGIKKNDEIIYSGNVNLAHKSIVTKSNE